MENNTVVTQTRLAIIYFLKPPPLKPPPTQVPNLVHDPHVLGEGLHLALDVGHHGLAVVQMCFLIMIIILTILIIIIQIAILVIMVIHVIIVVH